MKRSRAGLLILGMLLSAGSAMPQDIVVPQGFLTGNQYRTESESRRESYVMGVTDGFLFSAVWGGPESRPLAFKRCIENMNSAQTQAIVDKYMANHPERWHQYMQSLIYGAYIEFCPAMGPKD